MSESSLVPGSRSQRNGYVSEPGYPVRWSGEHTYTGYESEGGAGFREQLANLIDIAVRRRAAFILTFLAVVGIVGVVTFLTTPKFEASSWVLIDTAPNLGKGKAPDTGTGGENVQFVTPQRSVGGEILILEISNGLALEVGQRLIELGVVPGTQEKLSILAFDQGEDLQGSGITASMVARRLSRSYVEFDQESPEASVIRITATSSDAGEAALIANLYADEYVSLTREANRAHLSASRQFLEEQEEKWRSKLYEAEESVRSLGTTEGSGSLDQKGAFLVEQMARLESDRDRTSIDLQMRSASLSSLQRELDLVSSKLAGRIASSAENEIEAIRNHIATLETQRKEILFRYPDVDPSQIDNPELRAIESQLQTLRSELDDLSRRYVGEIEAAGGVAGSDGLEYVANLRRRIAEEQIAIDGMEAQIGTTDRKLADHTSQLNSLPGQSLRVARLERTRQHAAQMYESVVGRLQEVLIAEESEPGYARIVREAGVPSSPTEPNILQNTVMALLLAWLLACIVVVAVDKIDNRLYKPESFEKSGLDLIALVPNMRPFIKDKFGGKAVADVKGSQVSTSLIGMVEPSSGIAEAYRHLRTYIQFSGGSSIVRRTLITSPNMGEGKSVTAANLAIVMAQAGRRTLLIDADLRRPRLHKLFGCKIGPGLTDLLERGMDLNVESAFRKTSVANLSVLTAGKVVRDPSSLLASKKLRELLDVLAEAFDYIVIDSPPIRAANDAVLLSTQCDGTLLVVRAGQTRGPELSLAKRHLEEVGSTVLGVLFNAFDVSMAYGYAYQYSNYSDYTTYSPYVDSDEA